MPAVQEPLGIKCDGSFIPGNVLGQAGEAAKMAGRVWARPRRHASSRSRAALYERPPVGIIAVPPAPL